MNTFTTWLILSIVYALAIYVHVPLIIAIPVYFGILLAFVIENINYQDKNRNG